MFHADTAQRDALQRSKRSRRRVYSTGRIQHTLAISSCHMWSRGGVPLCRARCVVRVAFMTL